MSFFDKLFKRNKKEKQNNNKIETEEKKNNDNVELEKQLINQQSEINKLKKENQELKKENNKIIESINETVKTQIQKELEKQKDIPSEIGGGKFNLIKQ